MKVKFKIFRFDTKHNEAPHYDTFEVEASPNDRILDCLNKIRWEQDGSLAYRMSCAHGVCGSDGMAINGVPSLACQRLVKQYDYNKEIVIDPLPFFPVVKDLVVDMTLFFERMKSIHPIGGKTLDAEGVKEHRQTIEERGQFDDAVKCIMCACCMAACPVILDEEPDFIGPAALLRAQRYIFDSRVKDSLSRMKIIEKPYGIWGCKSYFQCTKVCPKKIKVTKAIQRTKRKILQVLHGDESSKYIP